MPFPTSPLGIVAAIAPGANPVDSSSWAFTDISNDIRVASGVQIQAGRQDESGTVDATRAQAVIDNRSGNYSRVNPMGTWYGQLAKGTPLEFRVTRINDTFGRTTSPGWGTDSVSGLAWSHVTPSAWAATGSAGTMALATANSADLAYLPSAVAADVEVTSAVSLSAVTTGAAWVHGMTVRGVNTTNYYRLHVEFSTDGTIGCKVSKFISGSTTSLTSLVSTGLSYSAGTKVRCRGRVVGSTLQVRAWLDGGTEPTSWTVSVDDDTLPEAGICGLYEWRVVGNTNVGTLTATVDDYRVDVIRATTPVPEWPVRWDQSARDVTAPIVGAGPLRRLSQGQSALRSPMYRQLLRYSPVGFWPLEDGSDSTSAASAVARGRAATCSDVTFGSDGPPGAAAAIQLNSVSSIINGSASGADTPDGYAGMILVKFPSLPAVETTFMQWSATGTVANWRITGNAAAFNVYGTAADGSSVVSSPVFYGLDPTQWFAMQLETNVSGGTVNWSFIIIQVGSTSFGALTGSYAGTAAKLTGFRATGFANCSYSMSWLGDNDLPFVSPAFAAVSAGYAGELAGDRLVRLAAEENVPLTVIGDTVDTAPMGVQTPQTLLALLRECEDADQGVLHERGAGLGYLTRTARYNGAVAMALDFNSGHVAAPPEPTDDDQRLRNRIILTRTNGSTTTAEETASIALNGIYSDEPTVNLATDDQLDDHAGWLLHLGTLDDLRWPRISLNLARNPSLIASWCAVRIGSRITIANPPAAVGAATLDLIVEGWTETLGPYTWDVELACSPAAAWTVGVYDTARYDSASTTLGAGVSSSATTLSFVTANYGDLWLPGGGGYDVLIAGEQIGIPAAGMGAVSGTGPWTQTATGCVRAKNAVVKAQLAGAEIHVATPGRFAL
jgi:hypothetical protein